jgi:NADH-quinone oxidoreductase subunit N
LEFLADENFDQRNSVTFNYSEVFTLALPEAIVAVTALVVLFVDVVAMRGQAAQYRKAVLSTFACVGCIIAIGCMIAAPGSGSLAEGMLSVTALGQFVKMILLFLTIFTVLISLQSDFTTHLSEYFALLLFASVGMMLLVSSENLLMIFIALELTSLSLYIITGFHKQSLKSAEAALKYFLFGGMSAAFMLFGLSLIYGLTNSIHLTQIAEKLSGQTNDPLFIVALVMTLIGFGFKIAAVPFHLWAPDAYEGAPTPSAAFIAAGSKVASFFILAKLMMVGFAGAEGSAALRNFSSGWIPALVIVASLSMVLGNVAAIAQSSVKRLLAYSAVAHAGYALLAVATNTPEGLSSLLYYTITYAITVLGAFGVVAVVERGTGGERFSDFAGLSRRSPALALCMMIFMLSLAGIPPLAGFFGKFYVFTNAVRFGGENLGLLWLVILAIATSAVSLYYYLQVLKQIYVVESPSGTGALSAAMPAKVAIILLAVGVLVLGLAPKLLLNAIGSGW